MRYELAGRVIYLVPGHAGKPGAPDPGAVDRAGPGDQLTTYEVEHTVRLVECTARALRELGAVAVVVTGSVSETANQINTGLLPATCAVSLHLNAATPRASGFEVWHHPRSTHGIGLANMIRAHLAQIPPLWERTGFSYRDRGNKPAQRGTRARSFVRSVICPAVLVEAAFISHAQQERLVNSASFAPHVAASVACGVAAWLDRRR